MKKAICIFASSLIILFLFVSCSNKTTDPNIIVSESTQDSGHKEENNTNQETTKNNKPSSGKNETTQNDYHDTPETNQGNNNESVEIELPEVYRAYPNLSCIGVFHQGLAPFVIQLSDGEKYGYIDINGNVIIEPMYCTGHSMGKSICSLSLIPTFEQNNYITVSENGESSFGNFKCDARTVYDSKGNLLFTCGAEGITGITPVSNGYFAIESSTEEFTGYVYRVTYFSTQNLRAIVTINNAKILTSDYTLPNENGIARVKNTNSNVYGDGGDEINLADYDPEFKPATNTWTVDVEAIEAFQGVNSYYTISKNTNTLGQIASVVLVNRDGIYYYATVDENGNVLMAPQKNIVFAHNNSTYNPLPLQTFYHDLCPAQDVTTGLWGYIDPYGSWKIEPQFSSATEFGIDGYATVDYTTIIDVNGNAVLSTKKIQEEDLYGIYTRKSSNGTYTYTLTIDSNGALTIHIAEPYFSSTVEGHYLFHGNQLEITGIGWEMSRPLNSNNLEQDGTYAVGKTDAGLIINGLTWTKVTEDQ